MSVSKKQSQYIAIALAVIIAVLFVGSATTSAHGSEESFEKQVGNILIDVGYSTANFTTDASVVFNFDVKSEEEEVFFTDVWVRIVKDTSTVFATGVHNARLGGALMTYKFPGAGQYELSVRYQNDGKNVVEATFPLVVEQGEVEQGGRGKITYIVLGFLGGLVLSSVPFMLMRRNRRKDRS